MSNANKSEELPAADEGTVGKDDNTRKRSADTVPNNDPASPSKIEKMDETYVVHIHCNAVWGGAVNVILEIQN